MTKKNEKIWTGNVRDAALTILMAVEKQQAYSNLLLHQTIEKYNIEPKDRALLTELTYGTLQHKMTLDYYLKPFIKGKLDDWVRQLLRLSLYQIHYLSRIPDHAAVNEAVNIAKRRGHKGISGVVNGILRSILREGLVRQKVLWTMSSVFLLKQVTLFGWLNDLYQNMVSKQLRKCLRKTMSHQ